VNRISQADKDDREPQLHHLKASGFLEESADVVFLLHWAWHYDNSKPKNELIINIAKNRDGLTGRKKMNYIPEFCQIRDLSEIEEKIKKIKTVRTDWDD
jgi:replicative DNA helicase